MKTSASLISMAHFCTKITDLGERGIIFPISSEERQPMKNLGQPDFLSFTSLAALVKNKSWQQGFLMLMIQFIGLQ